MKGVLGSTLLNTSYSKLFDYKKINKVDDSGIPNDSSDNIGFVDILNTPQNTDTLNVHIGLLEKRNDTDKKYLFVGNMNCAVPTKTTDVILEVSNPLSKFTNYNFKNVEPQFNYEETINLSGTNSFSETITFLPGDGQLFELSPVLKYGGDLIYDDVVSSSTTLLENMTIKPNADLELRHSTL